MVECVFLVKVARAAVFEQVTGSKGCLDAMVASVSITQQINRQVAVAVTKRLYRAGLGNSCTPLLNVTLKKVCRMPIAHHTQLCQLPQMLNVNIQSILRKIVFRLTAARGTNPMCIRPECPLVVLFKLLNLFKEGPNVRVFSGK